MGNKRKIVRQVLFISGMSLIAAIAFNAVSSKGIPWVYHAPVIEQGAIIDLYQAWKIYKEQSALFVDAQNLRAFQDSHIPGAINIPYNSRDVERLSAALDKKSNLIVYCYSSTCHQADILADRLKKIGFIHVAIFREGYRGWKNANYPLTAPQI